MTGWLYWSTFEWLFWSMPEWSYYSMVMGYHIKVWLYCLHDYIEAWMGDYSILDDWVIIMKHGWVIGWSHDTTWVMLWHLHNIYPLIFMTMQPLFSHLSLICFIKILHLYHNGQYMVTFQRLNVINVGLVWLWHRGVITEDDAFSRVTLCCGARLDRFHLPSMEYLNFPQGGNEWSRNWGSFWWSKRQEAVT